MMKYIIALIVICLMPMATLHADDATVTDCDNFIGAGTISAAVATANLNAGGTITFACSGTITFTSELIITNDVIINSNGNTVLFYGSGDLRFFTVEAGASLMLNGFTMQNTVTLLVGTGGAIYNDGTLTINNSTFTGNHKGTGGAIYNAGTTIINNSTFTGNSAITGGAIYNDGTLTINNSTFTGNIATSGGAIRNFYAGILIVNNSTFTDNVATVGGAVYNNNDTMIISSTFTSNTAVDSGGAIYNHDDIMTISNSTLIGNSAPDGGAIRNLDQASSTNTHYENNTCTGTGTINDNGGNTIINAAGCPGDPPIALDVSALSCNGDTAIFEIFAGDANFDITGTGVSLPILNAGVGLYGLAGPGTWTDVTITELTGDRESINLGGIVCPEAIVIPPSDPPAPVALSPDPFALGCTLTTDVDVAGAGDDTFCRILMRNGGVVNYSGAVPDSLIGLGVKLAVDVYRLEGGQSVTDFGGYSRVCLSGTGRLFYLDARTSPRSIIELATEMVGGATCGWIPAAGTLVLTN